MPPPALHDAWLASRRFGIVVDAGSSGSRLRVYSWKDAHAMKHEILANEGEGDHAMLDALPRVEKGVKHGDGWLRKVEPGATDSICILGLI